MFAPITMSKVVVMPAKKRQLIRKVLMNRKQDRVYNFTKDSHKISQKTSCSLSSSGRLWMSHPLWTQTYCSDTTCQMLRGSQKEGKWVQRTMWFCLGASRVGLREDLSAKNICSNLIPLHSLQGRGDRKTRHK